MSNLVYLCITVAILLTILENVRSTVDVVDNCDPKRWSKVELEGICKDFGYTLVGRLWYKMPGMDKKNGKFPFGC